jgi:hypothetical protein
MALIFVAAGLWALAPVDSAVAQPQPTMVVTPSSGPCDAPVEVTGSGFDRSRLPTEGPGPALYLLRPGTDDVSMGILNPVWIDQDGTFSAWAPLWKHGCEAAALDSQAEQPTSHLFVALSADGPTVELGERIPNIIAVAQYAYTTTAPHVPTENLRISPTSGPCDATVEVRGSGFQPGQDIRLKLARAGSDETLGPLASAVADADGQFVATFTLGELGCHAAQMNIMFGDPARPQLGIAAYPAAYPTPVPPGIPPSLAVVAYTFTTTEVSGIPSPRSLPVTGSGPEPSWSPLWWFALPAVLATAGVIFAVASLHRRRQRS